MEKRFITIDITTRNRIASLLKSINKYEIMRDATKDPVTCVHAHVDLEEMIAFQNKTLELNMNIRKIFEFDKFTGMQ